MNSIQNYGITNYQINFQAKGGKKTIKTLADVIQKPKKISQEQQKLNQIRNIINKMHLTCNCSKENTINEGIIDIIM